MISGPDIARVLVRYELFRLRSAPAGLEGHVRLLQAEGDAATLDEIAELAEAVSDAFQVLADQASQASTAIEAAESARRTEP